MLLATLLQTGWTAARDQTAGALATWIGYGGPALLAALLLVRVGVALARRARYRAVGVLGERDREAVHAALAAAERRTVGEILPVVVERSDPHPGAKWLAAAVVALLGTALLGPALPWDQPALVVLAQVALGALGWVLARALPDFQRLFVPEHRATAVAEEQAFQEFHAHGLHRTEAATGVLLFVSLLERRVVVLADEGIAAKVPEDFWVDVDAAVLAGIRRGSLRDGLVEAIHRAGDLLATEFPWKEGDRNEIPDRLIVRAE